VHKRQEVNHYLVKAKVRAATWPSQEIHCLRGFWARVNHPFIAPPNLHCSRYCNTIARLLRNIRPPPDPACVCHTPYNIGKGTVVLRPSRHGSQLHFMGMRCSPHIYIYIYIYIYICRVNQEGKTEIPRALGLTILPFYLVSRYPILRLGFADACWSATRFHLILVIVGDRTSALTTAVGRTRLWVEGALQLLMNRYG